MGIAYPQMKLASVLLGLVGANLTRLLLPEYTNIQAFFYFLCSDIPFYVDFKPANIGDPYYGRKIQFNTEQFFSKKTSMHLREALEGIDFIGNQYKGAWHKLSRGAVECVKDTGACQYISSSWHSMGQSEWIKPIVEQATSLQKKYYEYLDKGQEDLEKIILEELPQNEQCIQRLYQLELNKTVRMIHNGEIPESELEAVLEKLDAQYKKTIGGKSLEDWTEEYELQKELEIELARLERAEGLEDKVVETKKALESSRKTCNSLWEKVVLHNHSSILTQAKSYKQDIDNQAKDIIKLDVLVFNQIV
jgi:DNA-binding PadR family transcriptional regulator